eukprot:441315_1
MSRVMRKQRLVVNPLVDIDSVTVSPGIHYCDWIAITKTKLKEREYKLVKVKVEQIQSIINNECKIYNSNSNNFTLQHEFNATMKLLYDKINKWNGVNVHRVTSPLTLYRDY